MGKRTVWTVAVGTLPLRPKFLMPKATTDAIKIIKEQEGLVGVTPMYPRGTLLLFDTENHAKGARNVLRFHGIVVGTNICKAYVDESDLKGNEK